MKKLGALLLLLSMIGFVGCGGGDTPPPPVEDIPEIEDPADIDPAMEDPAAEGEENL